MATKKAEWLGLIRPILEKDDIKKDAKDLARELSDILDINIDGNANNLKQLTDAFNEQLINMGKQPIVFSEKTLNGIINQFANAVVEGIMEGVNKGRKIYVGNIGEKIGDSISDGIIVGITDGLKEAGQNIEKEFDALMQKYIEKTQEIEKLRANVARKKLVEDKLDFDSEMDEKAKISNIDALKKQISDAWANFDNANADLLDANDAGKVTEKLLTKWRDAAKELLKIKNTIADLNSQKIEIKVSQGGIFASTKQITKAEQLLDPRTRDYFLSTDISEEGIAQDISTGVNILNEYIDTDELESKISNIESELTDLENQMLNLTTIHPELISKKNEAETLSRIEKIQKAYEKLSKTATGQKNIDKIENALAHKGAGREIIPPPKEPTLGAYDDGYGKEQKKYKEQLKSHITSYDKAKKAIESAFQAYDNSVGKSWDERYRYLVKAAEEFNSIDSNENISIEDKVDLLGGYRDTYVKEIEPMLDIAKTMLQGIIDLRDGKQLIVSDINPTDKKNAASEDNNVADTPVKDDKEKLAREDAEKKAKAEKDAADAAEKKRIEEEKNDEANRIAVEEAEKERLAKEATLKAEQERLALLNGAQNSAEKERMTNTLKQVVDFSGQQSKEYMSLIGTDAVPDTIAGDDYTVATDVLVKQLIDNVKKSILMSLHNHPDGMLAFTPSDIASYGNLYKTQGVDIHGIIADGIVQTIDFTGISQEIILKIAQDFSKNLSEAADKSEGLFSFKNGDLKMSDDVLAAASESPDAYNKVKEEIQLIVNNALSKAFTDNKLQPTIKTFNVENLQQLAEYLLQVGQSAGVAIDQSEKLNVLMSIQDKIVSGKQEETSVHQENTESIKNEIKAEDELKNIQNQNADDDSEIITKENGALEDKLELLRDIADQYASNITQKQRDRYEELNQKDMDSGLTDKEDERYYELGEQIDAADSALEEFSQTYDKIILKLANGKKVEILPDDKGLRSLYKFADEYGETYGGIEIEDVIFERVKQEVNAHQENTEAIKNETKAQEELNDSKVQGSDTGDVVVDNNAKKIQSYEELNAILKEYLDLEKQKIKFEYTDEDWKWEAISNKYSSLNSLEQMKDDFDVQWKRVLNIKSAIKNGYDSYLDPETKSSERLQENTLEEETKRLKAIALAYADNTEANLDLLNKTQRKFVDDVVSARNAWQEDYEGRRTPYNEHNDPIEKRQNAIESIITDSTSLDNLSGIINGFYRASQIGKFDTKTVEMFAKYLGIELPQAAQTAGKAIDGLNNNLEETQNATQMPDTQPGTGDASSADVDAAKAEAEKQRIEKERIEAEKIALQQENDAKLKVEADTNAKLQADLTVANQQLIDAQEAKALADANTRKAEDESRVKDGIIQGLREQLANVKSGEGVAKASIDVEELKNVLDAITYNVKVVQDSDSAENKVAIDEASLKTTLNEVFESVIKQKPQTQQNDGEPKDAPWAREETLSGVIKETLAQIQANTVKIGTESHQAVVSDVGNVLATENTLIAIKTAVEAINTKVVKGTKTKTSNGGDSGKTGYKRNGKTGVEKTDSESYAGSQYFPEKLKTQTMYLAKFRAQLMTTGKLTEDIDAQIYKLLDGLKQVKNGPDFSKWNQQFLQLKTSVGITDIFEGAVDKEVTASYKEIIEFQKIRNKLELQYTKAQEGSYLKQFYAEQLAQMDQVIANQQIMLDNEEYEIKLGKMRAEQARKLEEAENKARDKDAKKQAANDKQMAKKNAMVGKAGNAIGRAENVWLGAQDTDSPLPPSLNKQIDNLYEKLVALREKQNEVNQAPTATEEQQKELREQTIEVNSLTNEVGELLSEYQKLSGANVDPEKIRITTLTEKSGVDEYRQQMKQYVSEITHGQGQIKNFDAATKTLTYTVKTGKNEFTEYTVAVRRADNAMVSVQGTTKRTETFFEATARKMKELTSYFSGMAIMSRVMQELRRGVQYVKEIDLALTELKKVTDETEQTYDRFLQTAAKTGARLGTTISAVTEATATFAKLGYSMEQAAEMAEAALVYKNVGDNITSAEDAADSIISTLKGFKLEASDSMVIVDKFNEVGE